MRLLCRCGASFMRSGIWNHQRQSDDPRCKEPLCTSICEPEEHDDNGREQDLPIGMDDIDGTEGFKVDLRGDFFGDYEDYSPEDFGMQAEEDGYEDIICNGDSDEDDECDEPSLEPDRHPNPLMSNSKDSDASDGATQGANQLWGGAEAELKNKPYAVKFSQGNAGAVYTNQDCVDGNTLYTSQIGDPENPFSPFSSKIEWEIVSTAFTELMSIDGVHECLGLSFKNTSELNKIIDKSLPGLVIGDEVCEVYFRDVIQCIKALFGDPLFVPYLVFAPEKHYTDETKAKHMYHDMHTGRWWWSTQEALEKDKPGATILPVIISTDKTQLTTFCNKSAYPLYLTLGNIPKEIRRKPSNCAYVLLAYLPTTRLENVSNKAARRRQLGNLYHACMGQVLRPLKEAGITGLFMASGDGPVHRNHPLLACFSGDYPEQVLTTCVTMGQCAMCPTPQDKMGKYVRYQNPGLRDLDRILEALDLFDDDPGGFLQACSEAGVDRTHMASRKFTWLCLLYVELQRRPNKLCLFLPNHHIACHHLPLRIQPWLAIDHHIMCIRLGCLVAALAGHEPRNHKPQTTLTQPH
ncbi:hypothetical protein BYT27DRAFT_7221289 [Phlegmacium glaucopus]|nr:hypothetical protein BYT27DRAFT_7221289 [Phlegmacium glaucopus]